MKRGAGSLFRICLPLALALAAWSGAAGTFRVATYNLDSYVLAAGRERRVKTEASRQKVRQMIISINPDVIALQEMGGERELVELRDRLKSEGLNLPHWELVSGADTNIHLAVLSRFPFSSRRPLTNAMYLLDGRRFRLSRGFLEVDVQVNSAYSFTLLTAHLKSKRPGPMADQADQRYAEARLLRERIDARLGQDPQVNLIVLGDLNDLPEARSTKLVLGRGLSQLVDTHPKAWGFDEAKPQQPMTIGVVPARAGSDAAEDWTYFYARENSRLRIDYLLVSRGMAREWVTNETRVGTAPGWDAASDHRPLIATFETTDR